MVHLGSDALLAAVHDLSLITSARYHRCTTRGTCRPRQRRWCPALAAAVSAQKMRRI